MHFLEAAPIAEKLAIPAESQLVNDLIAGMESQFNAPQLPEIIATAGPHTEGVWEKVLLIAAGARIIRENFSHGDHDSHARSIEETRIAAEILGANVMTMADFQGPKVRFGSFDGAIPVLARNPIRLAYGDFVPNGAIPVQFPIHNYLHPGDPVRLCDGKILTETIDVNTDEGYVDLLPSSDGVILQRKGIAAPKSDLSGDVVPAKDRADLALAGSLGVEAICFSFAHTADNIREMEAVAAEYGMQDTVRSFKVETAAAVRNIDEIVPTIPKENGIIMLGQGDLGAEIGVDLVPLAKRRVRHAARVFGRRIILATQVMPSMEVQDTPTRAEADGVHNAYLDGYNFVMFSEETAMGNRPWRVVQVARSLLIASMRGDSMLDEAISG